MSDEMTTRQMAQMAGMPDTVTDEVLFKFCDLYRVNRLANYATMKVDHLKREQENVNNAVRRAELIVDEMNTRYGGIVSYIDSKETPGFFNEYLKNHRAKELVRRNNDKRRNKGDTK